MINLSKVSKSYEGPTDGEPLNVFQNVNLELANGSSAAIVGPSGSGKSTLLNIIGALDKPTSGLVSVDNQNVPELTPQAAASFRNTTVGFIFQLHHLLPQCTVLENVLVPTQAGHTKSLHRGVLNQRARELLRAVGLSHRVQHRPGELSGGERQRVSVARALVNKPKLLLADEPTGALDRENSNNLVEILLNLQKENDLTLLVVTHSQSVAERMDQVFHLEDGTLRLQK